MSDNYIGSGHTECLDEEPSTPPFLETPDVDSAPSSTFSLSEDEGFPHHDIVLGADLSSSSSDECSSPELAPSASPVQECAAAIVVAVDERYVSSVFTIVCSFYLEVCVVLQCVVSKNWPRCEARTCETRSWCSC